MILEIFTKKTNKNSIDAQRCFTEVSFIVTKIIYNPQKNLFWGR